MNIDDITKLYENNRDIINQYEPKFIICKIYTVYNFTVTESIVKKDEVIFNSINSSPYMHYTKPIDKWIKINLTPDVISTITEKKNNNGKPIYGVFKFIHEPPFSEELVGTEIIRGTK